jgi:hypothetical protein
MSPPRNGLNLLGAGTMPWTGKQQRRAILNKYNASHMSWGGGGFSRGRVCH